MSLQIDQWNVESRPGGWFRLREMSERGPSVYLHYQLTGHSGQERVDLTSVVMRAGGEEALSGRVWRRLPLSDIEKMLAITLVGPPPPIGDAARAWAQMRDAFTAGTKAFPAHADIKPPSLDALDEYFEATADIAVMYFNPMRSGMLVSDGAEGLPPGRIPHIKPPEGRLTDDFLNDVAEAYRWFTETGSPPAPAIAQIADVPVRTVHRWVYEARKRGILPPARTGRAG